LALDDINKAISVDPASVEALEIHVSITKSTSNLESAIKSCKKIIRLDENNFTAWNRLAEMYAEIGNWVESVNSFNMLVKLKPEKASAYYEKAKRKFLKNKNTEALEYLKKSFVRNESAKDLPEVKSTKLNK